MQLVAYILNAVFGDFADVQQAIGAGEDLDKSAEIGEANDFPKIGFSHFGRGRNVADDLQGLTHRRFIARSDVDLAGVLNVDLHTGLLNDSADHLASRADQVANLVYGNLQRVDARSKF